MYLVNDEPVPLDHPLRTKKCIIYSIFNTVNEKMYIGRTVNSFWKRYKGGRWWLHTKNRLLKEDAKKYGLEAFRVQIENDGWDFTSEDLLWLESLYIYSRNTVVPRGYNQVYDPDPCKTDPNSRVWVAPYFKDWTPPQTTVEKSPKKRFHTEETKMRISKAVKGQKRTPEQNLRNSEARRGKKISQEHLQKLVEGSKRKLSKRVYQIDPLTKEVIKEYPSVSEAAKVMKIASFSNISRVIQGGRKTAGGFSWRYAT